MVPLRYLSSKDFWMKPGGLWVDSAVVSSFTGGWWLGGTDGWDGNEDDCPMPFGDGDGGGDS